MWSEGRWSEGGIRKIGLPARDFLTVLSFSFRPVYWVLLAVLPGRCYFILHRSRLNIGKRAHSRSRRTFDWAGEQEKPEATAVKPTETAAARASKRGREVERPLFGRKNTFSLTTPARIPAQRKCNLPCSPSMRPRSSPALAVVHSPGREGHDSSCP